jgi:fructokinase
MVAPLIFAGIEAGGTKFNCVIGKQGGDIVHQQQFSTALPDNILPAVLAYFHQQSAKFGAISALGIGSFGPLQLDLQSSHYGSILATPKPGWSGFNWLDYWRGALNIPLAVQTDVNVALLAEHLKGEAQGLQHVVYVTIGTGIGGGVLLNGRLLHGASHPELGHMRIKRHSDDTFAGVCPFHQDCLEGLGIWACTGAALDATGATAARPAPGMGAAGLLFGANVYEYHYVLRA